MENGESSYRRFLEGDERAFDRVLEIYRPGLIYFINSYVHDPDTAEDIAIDCFTYLLVHPKKYNFKTPLKTYLFILGRSRAIDFLRRKNKFTAVEISSVENELTDFDSLELSVLTSEIKQAVHKAINALPPDMQTAVHLVYFEDLSYKDTAKIMGKSVKQIDNLLRQAKNQLRSLLSEEGRTLL